MPVEVKGVVELLNALEKYTPDLLHQLNTEISMALGAVVRNARGFVPNQAPLSGWGKEQGANARFPLYDANTIKAGIGYDLKPSVPNKKGFTSLYTIYNATGAGAIYETAGRKNKNGRSQAKMREVVIKDYRKDTGAFEHRYMTSTAGNKNYGRSNNPNAGVMFVAAANHYSELVNAKVQKGRGRRSRSMKGRLIFKAWAQDEGKTRVAILKAIDKTEAKYNARTGTNYLKRAA